MTKPFSRDIGDYAPFHGDGRVRRDPEPWIPNTVHHGITNGQARKMIDRFMEAGHSIHSGHGTTLWVILAFCQTREIEYTLQAKPKQAYIIKKGTSI